MVTITATDLFDDFIITHNIKSWNFEKYNISITIFYDEDNKILQVDAMKELAPSELLVKEVADNVYDFISDKSVAAWQQLNDNKYKGMIIDIENYKPSRAYWENVKNKVYCITAYILP